MEKLKDWSSVLDQKYSVWAPENLQAWRLAIQHSPSKSKEWENREFHTTQFSEFCIQISTFSLYN